MALTHSIKSAEGRWLDCNHIYGHSFNWNEWIHEPLLKAWTSAKNDSDACARAVELCKELGGSKSSHEDIKEPLTDEAKKNIEDGLEDKKIKFIADFKKKYGSAADNATAESYWRNNEKQSRDELVAKFTVSHPTRWVKAPMTSWQTAPAEQPWQATTMPKMRFSWRRLQASLKV